MKKIKVIDDWKYSNQNWIKVLDEIWKYAPNRYGMGTTGYHENHPLARKLKIHDLSSSITFLLEHKLIEYDSLEQNWIHITTKGFDVALQNQNAVSNRRINKSSLYLSAVIAIYATINLFLGIKDIYIGIGVALIILVGIDILVKMIKKM